MDAIGWNLRSKKDPKSFGTNAGEFTTKGFCDICHGYFSLDELTDIFPYNSPKEKVCPKCMKRFYN